jgi:hypothetical protein
VNYEDKISVMKELYALIGELALREYCYRETRRECIKRDANAMLIDKLLTSANEVGDIIDFALNTTENIRKVIDGEKD